ncbi:hypothetical protein HD598_001001 [Neomicrococcus aestuarii]|uniref:DUF3027 domain-containing protein n=1 Tax=Neomicrococcus aestuarii TaxID=556325 RepID=A0A7W8X123_9MICC|nr:DUF3027 domain-containing protein [Neomicrococcus aestuarii]MBB5512314.1 hypothetical protein [Neomicrococcus aestuarii]
MIRKAKLDDFLAQAVDVARDRLLEVVDADQLGEHLSATADGERLVTHRFAGNVAGYVGWVWFVSIARVPRSKVITVCDLGLIPGEGALLAPEWVPWSARVTPEDIEADEAEHDDAASAGEQPADTSAEQAEEAATDEEAAESEAAEASTH